MSGGTFNKFSPADGDGLVSWLSDSHIGTAVWLALRANSYVKLFPESVTNIAPFELLWQTRNEVAAKFPVGLSSKSNNARVNLDSPTQIRKPPRDGRALECPST